MEGDMASGQIHFRSPKFLRVQQDTPKPEAIISDGNTLWWYLPHKNQVYRYPSHQLGKEIQLLNDIFQGLRNIKSKPYDNGYHQHAENHIPDHGECYRI